MMRFFFDTEFIEDGQTIDLISIGIVSEDGKTKFYAENSECDLSRGNDWVQHNVIANLSYTPDVQMTKQEIAGCIKHMVGDAPEFWAYYADYDWVVLCQLFGTMLDIPKGWPMYCLDVKQLAVSMGDPKLPAQTSTEHHAMNDAVWTKEAFEFLCGLNMLSELDKLH